MKPRDKMPLSQRAKQFMPFSALRGLEEALAAKEREMGYEEKKQLTEDSLRNLDRTVKSLRAGDRIFVTYYRKTNYISEEITFVGYDIPRRLLLTEENPIPLDEISEIEQIGQQ